MKLEMKHVAPYLPYGLKVRWTDNGYTTEKSIIGVGTNYVTFDVSSDEEFEETTTSLTILYFNSFKPILRPLSDLKNFNNIDSKTIQIQLLKLDGDVSILSYQLFEVLLEWHFDVFGLIEKGLAIDINTIEK